MSDHTPTAPKRLTRNTQDKMLGGVCSGMASYANLDPLLVRVLTVIGILFTLPLGLIAYFVLWAVIPAA